MNKRRHLLFVGLLVVFLVLGVGIANAQDPTATANEPSVAVTATPMTVPGSPDLEIVRSHWARCRESANSPQLGDLYWVVWELRNNRKDAWAKAKTQVSIVGPDDIVLDSVIDHWEHRLAPDGIGWITNPGLIDKGNALEGGGSRVEDIRLEFRDVQWIPVDESADKYEYDIEFLGYETGDGDYPDHTVAVLVRNRSDFVMKWPYVFGVFLDTIGNVVDVVAPLPPSDPHLPFGEAKVIRAVSASKTGRCLGPRDTAGHSLHYWLYFETYTDQPVQQYFTTELK